VAKLEGLSGAAVLEVQVHTVLREILRLKAFASPGWPHHLTMARLVARALRLGKPALMQTGVVATDGVYRSSYLAPALLWPGVVAIVSEPVVLEAITAELSELQVSLGTNKLIGQGLLLLTPEEWLVDQQLTMPVIIDGADQLSAWAQQWLQINIAPLDWEELAALDQRVQLTKLLFQRPVNPYDCYLLGDAEIQILQEVMTGWSKTTLRDRSLPILWQQFQYLLQNGWAWAKLDRSTGSVTLSACPTNWGEALAKIWQRQTCVLIGNVLDSEATAPNYRQEMGLRDITAVRFGLGISQDPLPLYVPNWMPMPNTPNFQGMFLREAIELIRRQLAVKKEFIVVVVGDTPLKSQAAAQIAAQYGSMVQVEKLGLGDAHILVTGWNFWCDRQESFPTPALLIVATLPIPSVEDPLVAARVSGYKQQRQDWFRLYLLPAGLKVLRRSISTITRGRSDQQSGMLAIYDNRINHRSYGQQIIAALGVVARIERPEFR
jgi:ATP-dependent DNA helicase DinG